MAQEPADKIFPLALEANVGIIARIPLRRGVLTGKMTMADEQRFQGEDVRARSFKGEAFAKELAKAERLRFLVHGPVKSLGQAALAFCVAHPAVSVTIPGSRNDQQMRENAAAGDLTLPAEDLAKVADFGGAGLQLSRLLKKPHRLRCARSISRQRTTIVRLRSSILARLPSKFF